MSYLFRLPTGVLLSPDHDSDFMLTPHLKSDYTPAGWKCSAIWDCGCSCLFYVPPQIPNDPNRWDNSSCHIPIINPTDIVDDFSVQQRRVCDGHSRPGYLSYNLPPGSTFTYPCRHCGYYLNDEDHFQCEEECEENHPEVQASEFFDGFCDGVVSCVICDTPIPYEEVYNLWKEHILELQAERMIENREEPDW